MQKKYILLNQTEFSDRKGEVGSLLKHLKGGSISLTSKGLPSNFYAGNVDRLQPTEFPGVYACMQAGTTSKILDIYIESEEAREITIKQMYFILKVRIEKGYIDESVYSLSMPKALIYNIITGLEFEVEPKPEV